MLTAEDRAILMRAKDRQGAFDMVDDDRRDVAVMRLCNRNARVGASMWYRAFFGQSLPPDLFGRVLSVNDAASESDLGAHEATGFGAAFLCQHGGKVMSNALWPGGRELPTSIPDSELGPLSRLMRGMGIDDKLAPIPTVRRVEEMPLEVGIPVCSTTPADAICQTCRIFEIASDSTMCPRCNRKHGIRAAKADKRQQHTDRVRNEITARKLDEIDPDWHQRFISTDAAARFYREELSK